MSRWGASGRERDDEFSPPGGAPKRPIGRERVEEGGYYRDGRGGRKASSERPFGVYGEQVDEMGSNMVRGGEGGERPMDIGAGHSGGRGNDWGGGGGNYRQRGVDDMGLNMEREGGGHSRGRGNDLGGEGYYRHRGGWGRDMDRGSGQGGNREIVGGRGYDLGEGKLNRSENGGGYLSNNLYVVGKTNTYEGVGGTRFAPPNVLDTLGQLEMGTPNVPRSAFKFKTTTEDRDERMLDENTRLQSKIVQLVNESRRKDETIKMLKDQNELLSKEAEKYKTQSKKNEFSSNHFQDELISLRSEFARVSAEHQFEMKRQQGNNKRWRFQVRKLKQNTFLSERKESKPTIPLVDTEGVAAEELAAEQVAPEEHAPVRSEEHATSSINVRDSDQEFLTTPLPTFRQKSIQFLERKSSLTKYEVLKLNNLREQDQMWTATEMNDIAQQLQQTKQLKKRPRSAAPVVDSKPKRSRRFSSPLPSSVGCNDLLNGTEDVSKDVQEKVLKEVSEENHKEGPEVTEENHEEVPEEEIDNVDEEEGPEVSEENHEEVPEEEIDNNDDEDGIQSSWEDNVNIKASQDEPLEKKYPDQEHLEEIRKLPLRDIPIFENISNHVKPTKNIELMRLLHSSNDPERLIKLMKVNDEEYEQLTGKKPGDLPPIDGRKDTLEDLSTFVKSNSWMSQLRGTYNKISSFVEEHAEFKHFDWITATSKQVDLVLGFFIISLVPASDGKAMGTRYTPDTLKQLKTGLKNVLNFFLKRSDTLESQAFPFFNSNYISKRNKYARVPQEMVQGDRKRKFINQDDLTLRDEFLTQDVESLKCPDHLNLIVGTALLEADVSRGTTVLGQIRRNYIRETNDETGKSMIVVKGNVERKTSRGNSKAFKPMDFKIRGEHEVKAIRKLLNTLPPVGCIYCTLCSPARSVGEDPRCVCQSLFLTQRNLLHWRPTDKTWFNRCQWSLEKLKNLTAMVSRQAGTQNRYTNGSIRPTNMTSMAMTGLTPAQIKESFQLQQSYSEQEKYKRLGQLMTNEEKRVACSVNTASGRNALRGLENKFGPLRLQQNDQTKIYDTFKKIMEKKQENEVGFPDTVGKTNVLGQGGGIRSAPPMKSYGSREPEENSKNEEPASGKRTMPEVESDEPEEPEKNYKEPATIERRTQQMEPSEAATTKDNKDETATVGKKVFAKIYGFPHWPARVHNIQDGRVSVVFSDGLKGENAQVLDFTLENLRRILKTGKFKKTGGHSKNVFMKEASNLGLSAE